MDMDDPKGQGHRSKVKITRLKRLVQVLFDRLTGNVGDQGSHGSGSKVTWVNAKGHAGQGQPKGHNIGMWAHINIKLLHFVRSKKYLSILRKHAKVIRF